MTSVVEVFAEAGMLAHQDRVLPDALAELSIRLDLAGAGDLLATLMNTCWGTNRHDCPHCAIRASKGTPDPHPKPPPPPPPPPPPTGTGWRS